MTMRVLVAAIAVLLAASVDAVPMQVSEAAPASPMHRFRLQHVLPHARVTLHDGKFQGN